MKKILMIVITVVILLTELSVNAQWIQQTTGTTADLKGISFLNESTGYVCGSGVILKTTNGGTNWVNVNSLNLMKPFMKIQALDENVVYCVGMFCTIIKSTNGGVNWSILRNGPSGTGISFFSLYFINSSTGWIGGQADPPYYFKTTNGGETFDSIPSSELYSRVNDLYFRDANNGLACGDVGLFRKTTNGGLNWNYVNIPVGSLLYSFCNFTFINLNTGYTISVSRKIFKTTDFGSNWDSLPSLPTDIEAHDICFANENKGWVVGSQYDVYSTTNGGTNWFAQGGGGGIDVNFINDSVGYKTGNSGIIYKTTNGGYATYITNYETLLQNFSLQNAYPNPFNPYTTIKFQIANGFPVRASGSDKVMLRVYDVTGREVQTLVNKTLEPGTYEVMFDGSGLNSGVYFYKLITGNYRETKKMLLIK